MTYGSHRWAEATFAVFVLVGCNWKEWWPSVAWWLNRRWWR